MPLVTSVTASARGFRVTDTRRTCGTSAPLGSPHCSSSPGSDPSTSDTARPPVVELLSMAFDVICPEENPAPQWWCIDVPQQTHRPAHLHRAIRPGRHHPRPGSRGRSSLSRRYRPACRRQIISPQLCHRRPMLDALAHLRDTLCRRSEAGTSPS